MSDQNAKLDYYVNSNGGRTYFIGVAYASTQVTFVRVSEAANEEEFFVIDTLQIISAMAAKSEKSVFALLL